MMAKEQIIIMIRKTSNAKKVLRYSIDKIKEKLAVVFVCLPVRVVGRNKGTACPLHIVRAAAGCAVPLMSSN